MWLQWQQTLKDSGDVMIHTQKLIIKHSAVQKQSMHTYSSRYAPTAAQIKLEGGNNELETE